MSEIILMVTLTIFCLLTFYQREINHCEKCRATLNKVDRKTSRPGKAFDFSKTNVFFLISISELIWLAIQIFQEKLVWYDQHV